MGEAPVSRTTDEDSPLRSFRKHGTSHKDSAETDKETLKTYCHSPRSWKKANILNPKPDL